MTTIKKIQVAVLAAVLVGSMLVGCGKRTDNSRATTAGNTAGDITCLLYTSRCV